MKLLIESIPNTKAEYWTIDFEDGLQLKRRISANTKEVSKENYK